MDRRVALAAAVACVAAVLGLVHHRASAEPGPDRAAGPTWAGVAPSDQAWVRAAIAKARPEAAQLIDDVDGKVTFRTAYEPQARWAGLTIPAGGRYTVALNLSYLDSGRYRVNRDDVVLHELGHVIDFEVVPDSLVGRLAAQVPVTGGCYTADTGDCTNPRERFAETFAKWALRGAVSITGTGYSIPMPASLEDWGAPLATLAAQLQASSGA